MFNERFTEEQGRVLMAFIRASDQCKDVKGVERRPLGLITKRALCVREEFPEKYEEVKEIPDKKFKKKFFEEFGEHFRPAEEKI